MTKLVIFLALISISLTLRTFSDPYEKPSHSLPSKDQQTLLTKKDPQLQKVPHPEDILLRENESQYQNEETNYSDDHECSENILDLEKQNYEYAEIQYQGQLWTDESFKKQKALVGKSQAFTRASSKMKVVKLFGDKGITAGDVGQGSLGNCYFLGAIAALAQHPDVIKSVFLTGDNAAGIYSTLWWIGGKPTVVTVDDYFPTNGQGGSWAFTKVKDDEQIWPMVLQKSWAKLAGSYQNTAGGFNRRVLHALTGAPVRGHSHWKTNDKDLFDMMEKADKNKFYMGTWTQKQECGIVNYHAYTLISVFRDVVASDGKSYDLVKVRNPWASNKWKGDFSKDSNLWTEELKKKYDVGEEGGTFYMKIADYKKCFYYTSVAEVREGYRHTFKEFKDVTKVVKRFNKLNADPFAVMVEVTPKRFIPGKQCSTSAKSINYSLYRVGKNKDYIGGTSGGQSSITAPGEVGEYEIVAEVNWKSDVNYLRSFVINIYSSQASITYKDGQQNTCSTKVDRKLSNGEPWYLSGQKSKNFNCQWFNRYSSFCKRYGTWGRNEGMVGNDACTGCGGGQCP